MNNENKIAKWSYNDLADDPGFREAGEKLTQIHIEREDLKDKQIPEAEKELERLKYENVSGENVSWQEVKEQEQNVERLNFKAQVKDEQDVEQTKVFRDQRDRVRGMIGKEEAENYNRLLEKSVRAFEMMKEASDEAKEVRGHGTKAKRIKPGERRASNAVHIPDPFTERPTDLWYKDAKEYLKNV